jgi:16S rRNA U516 pseudouridylate synthase RsuA-like enzyme
MRINKYLAHEGISTRRGADELIARGKVLINGRVAALGEKVQKGDKVELRGKTSSKKFLYYAYNKPIGVITHSPQKGEKDIKQSAKLSPDVFPVADAIPSFSPMMAVTDRLLALVVMIRSTARTTARQLKNDGAE